jgi:hypothetical protein
MRAKNASSNLSIRSRWISTFSKHRILARAPVEVFALFLVLYCESSNASTGSSWSKQPSWQSEDTPSVSRASKPKEIQSYSDISPFAPGSHNLALDLGQVFLMGDLTKYNDTIGTQLHYTYGVSDLFAFDSSFGFSSHSGGQLSMLTLLAGMRLNLSWYDKVVPYVILGMGFYRPSYQGVSGTTTTTTAGGAPVTSSSSDLTSVSSILYGIHIGPGIDLELSRNLFFGTALTFHNMFGSTQTLSDGSKFNLGGAYISFLVHIGATF